MKKKKVMKTVGVATLGAAVGAGLGIMFAPKKGSETREDLKKAINDLKSKIKNINIKETKKSLEDKVSKLEEDIESLYEEDILGNVKKKSKEILHNIEDLMKISKEKGEDMIEETIFNLKTKAIEVTEDIQNKLEKSK